MYLFLLLLTALFIISIFCTGWPVKLYHHFQLKELAKVLNVTPKIYGFLFSGVYSELSFTSKDGETVKIRFMEGSADALFANSGLEIRKTGNNQMNMEFYRSRHAKTEWGEFKRFLTEDAEIDNQWSILTDNIDLSRELWKKIKIKEILKNASLEQLLISHHEIILKFKRMIAIDKIKEFIEII